MKLKTIGNNVFIGLGTIILKGVIGNYDYSLKCLKDHTPRFNGYDEFLEFCMKQ